MVEIKGLQRMSLIEWPGKIACVVFFPGCNFRCPYCQNPDLFASEKLQTIPESKFFDFLRERKGWLDGVALSGGEPTLQKELPGFIQKIKELGYQVALETNGSNPGMLGQLIKAGLLDFIAMDIKGPLERYEEIVRTKVNLRDIKRSAELVGSSGIGYQFRTTFVPGLVGKQDAEKIGQWLRGAESYVVQNFRPRTCLDKTFESRKPYPKEELEEIARVARRFFRQVEVQG